MSNVQSLTRYATFIVQVIKALPDDVDRALAARMIAQVIYDAPPIFSGKASAAAISAKLANPKYRPCADHYRVRQISGERLMDMRSDISCVSDAVTLLESACSVHYVTSEENVRLRKLQHAYGPAAYTMLNIPLYDTGDLFNRRGGRSPDWYRDKRDQFREIISIATSCDGGEPII